MSPPFPHPPEAETGQRLFCLRHDVRAGAIGIALVGELDVAAADDARDVIARAQGAAAEVICDLHDVSFIDPCGLHVLLAAAARARRHEARFTLVNPSASVRRLIDLVSLEAVLHAYAMRSVPAPDARRSPHGQSSPVSVCRTRSQDSQNRVVVQSRPISDP